MHQRMFVCDGLQHGRIRRREENRKNLIVPSGISEADNNKRLRLTFCIEAIQTRSIARPLCDSRASCSFCTWIVGNRTYIVFQWQNLYFWSDFTPFSGIFAPSPTSIKYIIFWGWWSPFSINLLGKLELWGGVSCRLINFLVKLTIDCHFTTAYTVTCISAWKL